jgi:DNA-binding NarL/FixJ family response regulator
MLHHRHTLPTSGGISRIKVLIVEDDPRVAEFNRRYLARTEGFELVAVAGTGDEALAILAREPVDLVLLDIFMPGKNGSSSSATSAAPAPVSTSFSSPPPPIAAASRKPSSTGLSTTSSNRSNSSASTPH